MSMILLLGSTLADPVEEGKDIEVRLRVHYLFHFKLQYQSTILQCCQCYGKCGDGSYLLATYPGDSPNYFDCLSKCLAFEDPNNPLAECRFFTHDYAAATGGNCYLFSNCPKLDGSCLTCISGELIS